MAALSDVSQINRLIGLILIHRLVGAHKLYYCKGNVCLEFWLPFKATMCRYCRPKAGIVNYNNRGAISQIEMAKW